MSHRVADAAEFDIENHVIVAGSVTFHGVGREGVERRGHSLRIRRDARECVRGRGRKESDLRTFKLWIVFSSCNALSRVVGGGEKERRRQSQHSCEQLITRPGWRAVAGLEHRARSGLGMKDTPKAVLQGLIFV